MIRLIPYGLALFTTILASGYAEDDAFVPNEIAIQPEKKQVRKSPTVKEASSPFTGVVNGDHVRMRLQPDLAGHIVRELNKNELISVNATEGDFYIVEPPEAIKAYIFRSFVLDGVVEGNRVNVRLEPDLEAPVIGHCNSGDRVQGKVSHLNKKWLEIAPPSNTHFYIAKEFIDYAGGPELKGKMDKRKETVLKLYDETSSLAKSSMKKPFEEVDFERIKKGFFTIINDYSDFPKQVKLAKEALVDVQERYLEKRISYLEGKAHHIVSNDQNATVSPTLGKLWDKIEDGLYATWAEANTQKEKSAFYEEQKLAANAIHGVVEPFKSPVKNKPGDYIVKQKNLPVAYIYSTSVDLSEYVGKEVTLLGSPRENHSFAFPAYFVHEVE